MNYHYKLTKYHEKLARLERARTRRVQFAGVEADLPAVPADRRVGVSINALLPVVGDELFEVTIMYPKRQVPVSTSVDQLMAQLEAEGEMVEIPKRNQDGTYDADQLEMVLVDNLYHSLNQEGLTILATEQNRLWGRTRDSEEELEPNSTQVRLDPNTQLSLLSPGFDPEIGGYRPPDLAQINPEPPEQQERYEEYDGYGDGIMITLLPNNALDEYQREYDDETILSVEENRQLLEDLVATK